MARQEISYLHTDTKEIIYATKRVVDGEWIVFMDGMGQVSRKRASTIESIKRLDN